MTGTKNLLKVENGIATWRLRVWEADAKHPKGGRQISETFKVIVKGDATGMKAAEVALADFVTRCAQGAILKKDPTLNDLWIDWLDDISVPGRLSPITLRNYKYTMLSCILPKLGHIRVRQLTAQDLDAFYRGETANGAASATVTKYHRILSSMLRQAERWGLVTVSPTRNARAPRAEQVEIHPPTAEEVLEIIKNADGLVALAIELAVHTGARRGEIVGLKWSDIDFQQNTLRFERSAYEKEGGGVGIKQPKTLKSKRKVSLDTVMIERLKKTRAEHGAFRLDTYIFSNDGKTPWRPDYLTKEFEDVRGKGNTTRFHDLRHLHASELLHAGIDPTTVSRRLGHAKVSTTVDLYSHTLQQRDRHAAEKIEEILKSPAPQHG